jgi:hypothetical protein
MKTTIRASGLVLLLTFLTFAASSPAKNPTITVSSPAKTLQTTSSQLTASGTANDNAALSAVMWSLNNSPWSNATTFNGWTNWTAALNLTLPGTNTFRAYAVDTSGNCSRTNSVSFTYVVMATISVATNGVGRVTPNYSGKTWQAGKSYTLTAIPGSGYVFTNWTGSMTCGTTNLTFVLTTNVVLQANFIPSPFLPFTGTSPLGISYQGLFYDPDDLAPQSSGLLTASVRSNGVYTAVLLQAGTRYSWTGQFSAAGFASNQITLSKTNQPVVLLQFDLAGGQRVSGIVSNAAWKANLLANRTGLWSQPGQYTLLIPGGDQAAEPAGFGFGALSVDKTGNVSLSGALGDGSAIQQGAMLSGQGQWPLYISPYSNKGLLIGWLTVTNDRANPLIGLASWIKPPSASGLFSGGFNYQANVAGSAYIAANQPVLDMDLGLLSFTGGDLTAGITNLIQLGPNNSVTSLAQHPTHSLQLKFTSSSGLFSGKVTDPNSGNVLAFQGAVFQNQTNAFGYFPGKTQTGQVNLRPTSCTECH